MIIKYFAWVRDITNKDLDKINKDHPKSINELKLKLSNLYPELEKHINSDVLRYAINMEYTSTEKELNSTDEIAVFPPVSGG
tara:strand:+ start:211 stop:456 length:246 start_codon:yes stop_codon:yes gene_type:complete